jgi:hypothetical protein
MNKEDELSIMFKEFYINNSLNWAWETRTRIALTKDMIKTLMRRSYKAGQLAEREKRNNEQQIRKKKRIAMYKGCGLRK